MLNIRAAAVLAALGGALSKAEPTPANNRGWSSFIQYSTYRGAKRSHRGRPGIAGNKLAKRFAKGSQPPRGY